MFNTITGKEHDDELAIEKNDNLLLWRVVFILMVFLIAEAAFIMKIKESTIVSIKLPPKIMISGTASLGLKRANKTYHQLWGSYLVDEIANFEEDTINEKMNILLDNMRPTKAIKKVNEIDTFKIDVVKSKIKQKFTVLKEDFNLIDNGAKSTHIITGIVSQKIDNSLEPNKECSYTVNFEIFEGVLYVEDFGSNCFN